ncbi:BTAD domain-containing putative transcriptional regulator [Micromonospora purpureochromogenes]|uniref:DNA-binding SARP family transcriptional activator n=1 Tax=Micromonospora purpureochromogenes TaxID=47872 RepID=A0ABX2RSL1_9ACTN|nr:BTAD domain-containing putative transcriptional regulator [Micromonospora purpureochromogenes]NYF59206.1 DNA-binding SARP family transcriptional activator [Micromonospora purpureochromogenes]
MSWRAGAPAVTFGVLGPVQAIGATGPVPLRGPRHRAVLARLLVARGQVVSVDRLVGDLWETPPDQAVAAVRTFVADLRRALEPERAPRQPARLLVTAPPGYALRAAPEAVDAWRFETAVAEAGRLIGDGDAGSALARLTDALACWRGPAYAEFADQGWARAEVTRLDELRMLAVERRGEALLALGRAAEAAVELEQHAAAQPLREDAWRLWATALYRSGRQGEALAALRRARETLAAELGLDPGPGLRRLEADILAQAPHLDPAPPVRRAGRTDVGPSPDEVPAAAAGGVRAEAPRPFVGRREEQDLLGAAAAAVARHRRPALALVSGGAGAGKTALAEALTRRLAGDGWATAWGRSPEYEGAPVAWPWAQITRALAVADPSSGGPTQDPAVARFRRHRAAVDLLTAAAGRGPVLLVLDDLHRADEDTLDLLAALFAEPEPVTGPVLVVGVFRSTGIGPELTAALARLARSEPVRVYLDGLDAPATGELARAVVGRDLDPPTVDLIHRRSGGNPFYVRELARLLAAEGPAALESVPPGVRDVIRHRLAQLTDPARTVVQQAAVLGRDVDPDLLAAMTGDEAAVLDALDDAVRAGVLTEQGPAARLRFAHILVRDTVYGDLSAPRRSRWHTAAGAALERLHPEDVTALAHHFCRAGTRAAAPRAASYATAAAEQAERRSLPHLAARLWQQAVDAHELADDDPHGRLRALMGLGRALAVTGHLDRARRHRDAALTAAERLDDPRVTADVLAAFEVPAIWTRNDDDRLAHRIVEAAERTLAALGGDRPADRSRLLSTLALELRGGTTDRGHRAAVEAEAIARRLADPALLAFALNARFMHAFARAGLAPQRARIGAELVELAREHELVTFEVLGHLVLLQARCALADLDAADAHAAAADRLADRYELPLVGVFTRWYAALRLAVGGRVAAAEAAYRAAHARLPAAGMPGMENGLLPLALLSLRLPEPAPGDRPADVHGLADEGQREAWGPHEPWVRPLVLLAAGRRDEAGAALGALPESPHDLLREARLCLAARAALALDDRTTMRYAYAELLPAADELAGAGSGVLTLGPVAGHLADLATALGRPDDAAAHRRRAAEVAARAHR